MVSLFSTKKNKVSEDAINSAIDRSLTRINELEQALKNSQNKLIGLAKEKDQLKKDAEAKAQTQNEESSELEAQLLALKAERDSLSQKLKAEQDKQKLTEGKAFKELRTDISSWVREKSELLKKNSQLEQENRKLKADVKSLKENETRIKHIERENLKSKEKLADWLMKFGEPGKIDHERFIEKVSGISEMNAETASLLNEIKATLREGKNAEFEQELADKQAELKAVEDSLAAYKAEIAELLADLQNQSSKGSK